MKIFSKFLAIALFSMGGITNVAAANAQARAITLVGDVKLVKVTTDDDGEVSTELVAPDTIVPGDKLIFTTVYSNSSDMAVENFVVTNPVPEAVRLETDADTGLTVSVDGGANWGMLAELRVEAEDGSIRKATHGDVTHIRWTLATVEPGESGRLEYPAIIR